MKSKEEQLKEYIASGDARFNTIAFVSVILFWTLFASAVTFMQFYR